MTTFVQLIVDGLAQGSIYAALALAIVLVNQATGLINFAQGGMAVLSAFIALTVTTGLAPALGTTAAIIVAIVVALLAIVLAWKLFKGLAKTAALVVILVLAAIFVFGVHH